MNLMFREYTKMRVVKMSFWKLVAGKVRQVEARLELMAFYNDLNLETDIQLIKFDLRIEVQISNASQAQLTGPSLSRGFVTRITLNVIKIINLIYILNIESIISVVSRPLWNWFFWEVIVDKIIYKVKYKSQ